MEYLVFCDTETGGLNSGQPILQIAWHVVTTNNVTVKKENHYLWPKNWKLVDSAALAVNKLDQATLKKKIKEQGYSITLDSAVRLMLKDAVDYKARFVAYNSPFDVRMIKALISANLLEEFLQIANESIDVMVPAADYIESHKWLSLVKAYKEIVGKEPLKNAHEANADISMTREIYYKLSGLNKI